MFQLFLCTLYTNVSADQYLLSFSEEHLILCHRGDYTHLLGQMESHSFGRMASSGMLRPVALVRTDVSEKLIASIIRMTRIGELETRFSLCISS
jgi:hypothetical protein